jgi:AcrR family transcriptional regulator
VIGTAGVPRKTFYELFDSKEDCFLAAYDILLGRVLEDAEAAFALQAGAPWPERIETGLRAVLGHLAAHPEEARFALVEVLAAGPKALARRDLALRQFTGFIETGRAESTFDLPGSTAQTIAGGITELLYSDVLHGAATGLPGPPAGARLPDRAAVSGCRTGGRGARPHPHRLAGPAGSRESAEGVPEARIGPLRSADSRVYEVGTGGIGSPAQRPFHGLTQAFDGQGPRWAGR